MGALQSLLNEVGVGGEEIPDCNVSNDQLTKNCNYTSGTGDEAVDKMCPSGSFYVRDNLCLDHINGCNENTNTSLSEICKYGEDNALCEEDSYYYDNSCNPGAKLFPCNINEDCSGNASAVSGNKGDCTCNCSDGWEGDDCGSIVPITSMSNTQNASFDRSVEPNTWRCNADYYMHTNNSLCLPCPENGTTLEWGATSIHECICPGNNQYISFDSNDNPKCESCPLVSDGSAKVLQLSVTRNGDPDNDCGCDETQNYFERPDGSCVKCPIFSRYIGGNSSTECDCVDGYTRRNTSATEFECDNNCKNQCGIYRLDENHEIKTSMGDGNASTVLETPYPQFVNDEFMQGTRELESGQPLDAENAIVDLEKLQSKRLEWLVNFNKDLYNPSYFTGITTPASDSCQCQFGISNNKKDCGTDGWDENCSGCQDDHQLVYEGGVLKCKPDGCYAVGENEVNDPLVCFDAAEASFTNKQWEQLGKAPRGN